MGYQCLLDVGADVFAVRTVRLVRKGEDRGCAVDVDETAHPEPGSGPGRQLGQQTVAPRLYELVPGERLGRAGRSSRRERWRRSVGTPPELCRVEPVPDVRRLRGCAGRALAPTPHRLGVSTFRAGSLGVGGSARRGGLPRRGGLAVFGAARRHAGRGAVDSTSAAAGGTVPASGEHSARGAPSRSRSAAVESSASGCVNRMSATSRWTRGSGLSRMST